MGKISFILPIYNCEYFIEQCLDNLLNSEIENYEVILVDDGSLDKSGEICDEYDRNYKPVKTIHQNNQGVSAARNTGLVSATGDYVVFLDVDDEIETEKLSELLRVLEKDCTIDMAIFGLSFDFYHAGQRYRCDELSPALCGKIQSNEWISKMPELYYSNSLSPIWNKVIKRSVLIDNQLEFRKDMFLYEDLEFSLRCMAYCEKIYFCPEIIYHYRQAEDEGNAGRRLKRIEHLPVLIEQIELAFDELLEQKNTEEYQNQIKSILMSLYLVLAREKIVVSNVAEIRQACDDFIIWFTERNLRVTIQQKKFVGYLLNRQVGKLIAYRTYLLVRHNIAVRVKSKRIYQKLKG